MSNLTVPCHKCNKLISYTTISRRVKKLREYKFNLTDWSCSDYDEGDEEEDE